MDYKNLISNSFVFIFLGKSLICKEKAIQVEEKEVIEEEKGSKSIADPVFFISMVGVHKKGFPEKYEYIFDIYTKNYDFLGSNVQVISAQDLWTFYESKNRESRPDRRKISIYFLVEFFIEHHSNGHYVLDECPLIENYSKLNIIQY